MVAVSVRSERPHPQTSANLRADGATLPRLRRPNNQQGYFMSFLDKITYQSNAQDCVADIHPSFSAGTFEVVFNAKGCRLEIAEDCKFRALKLYFLSDNTHVRIGAGTLCNSSFWANLSGSGRSISIGEHCLFASVKARTSDAHHIIDDATGKMINPAGDIVVSNRVWIAEDVLLLKGASIGEESVIGAKSMVNSDIPPHSLAAGIPAKVIRSNISWRYSAASRNPPTRPAPAPGDKPSQSPAAPAGPLPRALADYWQQLRKHVTPALQKTGDALADKNWTQLPESNAQQKTRFVQMLLDGKDVIALKGGPFRFRNPYDLAVQLDEIFCGVQYNFEPAAEARCVIDAGGCYGLASYLFSRRHPRADILAFEPNPENAAIFRENIERIGMKNVTLEEAAVGPAAGSIGFHVSADMPMGSSTSSRLAAKGFKTDLIQVRQVDLPALTESRHVDLLKLDVEGSEYDILDALDGRMQTIRNLFIELHFGSDLPKSKLAPLLAVLDRNGFDHMITRAGAANASPPHPLTASRDAVWSSSLNLWARAE